LAVALTRYIYAIALSIGKLHILTTHGAETPEPILTKPGMVDYVRDPTPHDNFSHCGTSATWMVWAHT